MKTVIEMAREAGAGEPESLYGRTDYVVMTKFELERFAELVRADEREACAKVCDCLNFVDNGTPAGTRASNRHCAAAIRARNEHEDRMDFHHCDADTFNHQELRMNIIENTPATAKAPEVPRYFHFSQNNSGGSFDINEKLAHHVIIQAHSASEANRLAKDVGIYFDGCESGADCDCCGDRWSEVWDKGDETPLIYGSDPATYHDYFARPGQPVCHVYHLDGSKTTYRQPEKEKA